MEGCSGVIHVASPFPNVAEIEVTEEAVVTPAREGTLRVLRAAAKVPSIKRVVLTSSGASMFCKKFYRYYFFILMLKKILVFRVIKL